MKGESSDERSRVQPASTASASEMDGLDISSLFDVGISWVSRRALDACPSVIPAFKLKAVPHTDATLTQSGTHIPLGALGLDLPYASRLSESQLVFKEPPLPLELLMISESVFPNSGKRWGKLLPHVLDMHGGLEGEKNAPKTPTDIPLNSPGLMQPESSTAYTSRLETWLVDRQPQSPT